MTRPHPDDARVVPRCTMGLSYLKGQCTNDGTEVYVAPNGTSHNVCRGHYEKLDRALIVAVK
jgi:hypothetical protein